MNDKYFMKKAIEDAKRYGLHFGAVVVKSNKIIAKAGKRPRGDARFHAEMQAILKACKKLKTKSLEGCTLYATCEPCPMCFYMAWITNIPKIVYGATLKDAINFGFPEIKISVNFLNKRGDNKIELKGRFMRDECLKLFRS